MKKFIALAVALMSSVSCFSNDLPVQGVWTSDDVELTFTADSVFIDEIGVEGFGYSYQVDTTSCIITLKSDVIQEEVMRMEIMDITPDTLSIRWLDSDTETVFEYKRKGQICPQDGSTGSGGTIIHQN